MSIWNYDNTAQIIDMHPPDVYFCHFCGQEMKVREVVDFWPDIGESVREGHKDVIKWMCESTGGVTPEDVEIGENLDPDKVLCARCAACGWWRISKQIIFGTVSQIWWAELGTAGILKNLDFSDMNLPIDEIRSYLCAKYDTRFSVSPKKFEDVVASVFSNIGYKATVTGFTCDGGIDVVLERNQDDAIGVQVKRYRNSIEVEQIRAFLGALVINNYTRGVFVTTSRYQRGAAAAVSIAESKGVFIELMNGDDFLSALKVAQCKVNNESPEFFMPFEENDPPDLQYLGQYHFNSL